MKNIFHNKKQTPKLLLVAAKATICDFLLTDVLDVKLLFKNCFWL